MKYGKLREKTEALVEELKKEADAAAVVVICKKDHFALAYNFGDAELRKQFYKVNEAKPFTLLGFEEEGGVE